MQIILVLLFLSNVANCDRYFGTGPHAEYSLQDEQGVSKRTEIVDYLRKLCGNCPPQIKKAAETLANYSMTEDISQYIEAFFSKKTRIKASFQNFLNGFITEGDPNNPAWQAAVQLRDYKSAKSNHQPPQSVNKEDVLKAYKDGHDVDFTELFREGKLQSRKTKPKSRDSKQKAPNRNRSTVKEDIDRRAGNFREPNDVDIYSGKYNVRKPGGQSKWRFDVVP